MNALQFRISQLSEQQIKDALVVLENDFSEPAMLVWQTLLDELEKRMDPAVFANFIEGFYTATAE